MHASTAPTGGGRVAEPGAEGGSRGGEGCARTKRGPQSYIYLLYAAASGRPRRAIG